MVRHPPFRRRRRQGALRSAHLERDAPSQVARDLCVLDGDLGRNIGPGLASDTAGPAEGRICSQRMRAAWKSVRHDLLAVIVLAPEVGVAPVESVFLFPTPANDPFYGELLTLRARLTTTHPLYQAAGLQYVP